MGYIQCCSGRRKTKSYAISPNEGYLIIELDYLECCPKCGHTVAQLTRVNFENKVFVHRKVNEKARKLFQNLESSILYKKENYMTNPNTYSKFYLNYNEYGVKKKCYSNLSTLKIGLFEY